jgi:hypothetical protein
VKANERQELIEPPNVKGKNNVKCETRNEDDHLEGRLEVARDIDFSLHVVRNPQK